MQLEAADGAGRDEPSGFSDGGCAAGRIDADEWHRDVGVGGREREDVVVRQVRPAGQPLVDGEDDAGHLARTVVVRERARAP